ncbi:MAG: glycosyltransferase family 39 protein, partial [Armatimonadetes bacterium]|nr:glycosyltransferase family 39 protein [Armatimonadota bacterium]
MSEPDETRSGAPREGETDSAEARGPAEGESAAVVPDQAALQEGAAELRPEGPGEQEKKGGGLDKRAVLGPAIVLVALSLLYSYVIPLGYGPDEPRHYGFIRLLWGSGQLSRVLPDGRELGNAIAIHPPTYYFVEGVLWYPARALGRVLAPHLKAGLARRLIVGAEPAPVPDELLDEAVAYRLLRLTSPLWGLATLLLVFAAVRRLMPSSPQVALGVAWVMALWPHLLMNFATITNDCGADFAGALFVWYWACRAPRGTGGWRHAAWAGALAGLGGMMKGQLLLCLTPVAYVALAWPYGRRFWADRRFWGQAAVATVALLVIAGPWYARNFVLYGQLNYVAPGYQAIRAGMGFLDALMTGIVSQAL